MNPILILFESGHLAEVRVNLYKAPAERSRLLDAYVTTECEGAVTRSARRAAEAVLSWLPAEHRPKEPTVAGFDISGLSSEQTITGESAGLAFAIALAAKLTGQKLIPLAATGILKDSHSDSEIMSVKAICTKIKCAIAALPSQSTIFFPQTNQRDCDDETALLAEQKEVSLEPVVSLDQVLSLLMGDKKPASSIPPENRRKLIAGIAAAVILMAAVASIMSMRIDNVAPVKGEPPMGVEKEAPGGKELYAAPDISKENKTNTSEETLKEDVSSRGEAKAGPSGKGFD